LEALVLLMAVLIVTCLLLVPAQGMVLAGVEVLVVGVADWVAIVTIHLRQLRNWQALVEAKLHVNFVVRAVLSQLATLPIVAAGVAVLSWGASGLYLLVAGVILSFVVAVAEAWVLLVEIHR
jgi:modulator of FtsH protease